MKQRSVRRSWWIGAAAMVAALAAGSATNAQSLVDDTRPYEVIARAFQPRFGAPGSFIRVSWQRPSNVPTSSVLGYVIWRGDSQSPAQVVGGLDSDASRRFVDSGAARTARAYDGLPAADDAGERTEFEAVPGVRAGERYAYQVTSAYRNGLQDRDNDGEPDDANFMTPLSSRTRWITALEQPAITAINGGAPANGTEVDPLELTVTWQQASGANQYVIWASPDPSFRRAKKVFSGGKTLSLEAGGPETVTKTLSLTTGKLRKAKRLFIAVGALNSRDPKPAPFGAIFSRAVQLKPLQTPPPLP